MQISQPLRYRNTFCRLFLAWFAAILRYKLNLVRLKNWFKTVRETFNKTYVWVMVQTAAQFKFSPFKIHKKNTTYTCRALWAYDKKKQSIMGSYDCLKFPFRFNKRFRWQQIGSVQIRNGWLERNIQSIKKLQRYFLLLDLLCKSGITFKNLPQGEIQCRLCKHPCYHWGCQRKQLALLSPLDW